MPGKRFIAVITIALSITVLLNACSKSKDSLTDGTEYYIKFKIDGNTVSFTDKKYAVETDYTTVANSVFSNGNYLHIISGAKSRADLIAKKNFMSLSLLTTKNLSNNISFASNTALSENYLQSIAFALGYTDENGKQYLAYGEDFAPYVLQVNGITISTNNKVTFTEVTDDHVKGEFYGFLYADDFKTEKKLTEGEFYLHLVK